MKLSTVGDEKLVGDHFDKFF